MQCYSGCWCLQATSGHLGMLKAKLAKLRRELLDPASGGGGGGGGRGDGFDVNKVGDARIGLVGAPRDCCQPVARPKAFPPSSSALQLTGLPCAQVFHRWGRAHS